MAPGGGRVDLPLVPCRSASELASALAGRVVHGDPTARYEGVSTDSRTVLPGELFVALKGERFDGAAYLRHAARRGAAVALVSSDSCVSPGLPDDMAVIEVADSLAALGDLARRHRAEVFQGRAVFGITGSAGKTSTRGFLHEIVRPLGAVASEKSFNNAIGVPLTILRLRGDERYAVIEIGTNAPGEIRSLCDVARPTVGIVTNVAPAHLEKLGTVEAVASEKGDLYRSLPASGVAIVNVGEPLVVEQARSLRCRVVTIGVDREADFTAVAPRREEDGSSFLLDGRLRVRLRVPGLFHVENALAALAAAAVAGVPLAEAAARVSAFAGEASRLAVTRTGGVVIVDDCYNSNPRSCSASLRELASGHGALRRIAVLGEMLELGASSAKWHEAIGEEAGRAAEIVVAVGAGAGGILLGARRSGIAASRLFYARDAADAETCVLGLARPGDAVLVKGSRRIGLERVVAALGARFGGAARST
jgi:UDP-N-acetylmuramoyl-tripeptide--D-alanyl-D-alanine ligase